MAGVEAVIHDSAMAWDLQQDCVDCAAYALHELHITDQNKIAEFIKTEMDSKYGLLWYCICGHSFGSLVGHDEGNCIYFSIDNIFFLIWRMDQSYESKVVDVDELLAAQKKKREAVKVYY